MEELTRESIEKLSDVEKEDLKQFLLSKGIDPVYIEWLIYGKKFNDVVINSDNEQLSE